MRRTLFTLIFCLTAILKITGIAHAQTLIHYWHFNNFTTTYPYAYGTVFPIGPIDADFSTLDTSKARIYEATFPGTSPGWHSSYIAYIDPYPTASADYDTVNLRMGQPGGTALRPRNPLDSAYLLFFIPTNNYQNIILTWGAQSSSTGAGDGEEWFDYSVDSGVTYTTAGLSELHDSAWLVFHRVTVTFANPLVNNNPKLVFRIHFVNNTVGSTGNNRFDNITVDGDTFITTPTITTTRGPYGPFCNATTTPISVPFTTLGAFTGTFLVELSNSSGSFASGTAFIGSGTSSPITASIPYGTAAGTGYRIRVVDTASPAVYGSDNGYNIIVNGPPTIYAVTGGGASCPGTTGVSIGIANSQAGASYQLYLAGAPVGIAATGTGSAMTVGSVTTAGTYLVKATFGGSAACLTTMSGVATVVISPAPAVITGTPSVCAGQTVTLHDATTGGTWSSGNTALATVVTGTGAVTGETAGMLSITYIAGGCPATVVFTVNPLSPITGVTNMCVGATTGLSDAITGGTWSATNTNASIGLSSGIATGIRSASTDVITYTTPGGCAATTAVSVNLSPSTIGGPTAVCASATINLTDAITGGTWLSATTTVATIGATGAVTGVDTGHTLVTYTLPDGCAVSTTVAVSLAPGPISGPTTVCAATTVPFSDDVPGGLWTSSNTTVATVGSLTGEVTGALTGTSVITYSLGSSCTVTETITTRPSPLPVTGTINICSGATTLLSDLSSGGTWSGTTATVATITAGGNVTGTGAGTSVISYTLAGCPALVTLTVNETPAAISGFSTVCAGSTISLSDAVTGGSWSSFGAAISVSSSGVVSGLSAGTATVTYAIGPCNVTMVITVNPVAAISGSAVICIGSSSALVPSISGGTWLSSNTTVATIAGSGHVTGASPGTSLISYTLAGCLSTATVTVNTTPTPIGGLSSVCAGLSVSLSDGVSGGSWSSAGSAISVDATGLVSGLSAGTAIVTYAIGSCDENITITVNPVATMGGPTGVCVGSTADLIPSISGGTWVSVPTSMATVTGSGVVRGVTPGTATITYTLPTGCITTTNMTVNTVPTAIIGDLQVCAGGGTTSLSDDARGGTWSIAPGSAASVGLSSGSVTGVSAGTSMVTYSLGTGCTVTAAVTVNPLPALIGGLAQVCVGLTTALSDGTTGGFWSVAGTAVASVSITGVVSGLVPGTDSVRYIIPTGCMSVALVTVNPLPGAITESGYLCLGLTTDFSDISGTGGSWSSSNTSLATIDPVLGVATGVGAGGLIITYTLPTTCIATLPVTVNSIAPPIGGVHSVCEGLTTALVDALPGGAWSTSNSAIGTVSGTGVVSGVSAGVITISYITAICPAVAIVTVNPIPGPVSGNTVVCVASYDTLTDAGGGTWSSSDDFIASANVTTGAIFGLAAGVAIITYTTDIGCSATFPVTVNPLPPPIFGAGSLCLGNTLALSETAIDGVWSSANTAIAPVSASGVVAGLSAGVAIVSYTIASGCAATRTISVISVPAITGVGDMCAWGSTSMAHDSLPGGSWTSSSVLISSTGLVTSYAPGTASVTYSVPPGCSTTTTITVNPAPGPITGNPRLCVGLTTSLSDTTLGGNWSSSAAGVAGVAGSGIITGVASGTEIITYTSSVYTCPQTIVVTVSPLPSAISSSSSVICMDASTTFFDAVPGGTWSSSNTSIATVSSIGIITGVNAGAAIITYTLGASCEVTNTISVNPLPVAFTVTGTGAYCLGGAGRDVGLSESLGGVKYQLYDGATPIGSPWPGTYANIDFGYQSVPGVYTVIATDTVTTCSALMTGAATIAVEPLPAPFMLTGGGSYCSGGTGVPVGLGSSNAGVNYQLYNGTSSVGGVVAGTGGILNFGLKTAAGTYGVIATDGVTGCSDHMSDSVIIIVEPLVTPTINVSSSMGDDICAGTATTFNATITNGGSAPVYRWTVDGASVAAAGSSYAYTPANGDVVKATLTSSAACASPATVSNTVTMTVQPILTPSVVITATPGTSIVPGQSVTFTATVTNGGTAPTYQWSIDGIPISGETAATFITNTLINGEIVACVVTNTNACGGHGASSPVTITVNNSNGIPQITSGGDNIIVSPNPNRGEFTIMGTVGALVNTGSNNAVSLEITNMLGQVIYKDVVTAPNGEINKQILLNKSIANGMYLLNLHSETGSKVFHLVIEQ